METVWSGNWRARLAGKLEALDHTSVHALLLARSGQSYDEVAGELGDIAPAQLAIVHLQHCLADGSFFDGAAECLARYLLARLTYGWEQGRGVESRTASAFAAWISDLLHDVDQAQLDRAALQSIRTALREIAPPPGWLPQNGRDPLIQRAFRLGLGREATDGLPPPEGPDSPLWASEWRARFQSRLLSLGFGSTADLLAARDGATYAQVAAELGDIPPAQVTILHLEEGRDNARFPEAAADCLARYIIQRLKEGWGRGFLFENYTASAFIEWSASVLHKIDQPVLDVAALKRIEAALRQEVCPSVGWLPASGQDPLVAQAFRLALDPRRAEPGR